MRKKLPQVIGEAKKRLPKQNQVAGDLWSTAIGDDIGGVVTVTFVKCCGGWTMHKTDY